VRHMTRSLTQNFGYTALLRGSSPMIGAVPIQNALLMGGYGLGLQYSSSSRHGRAAAANDNDSSNNSNDSDKYMAIFVGGCSGGVLQSFIMSPVELVKVSQQCATTTQSLRTASVPVVWNLTHGHPSRAWTGLGATLLRDGIPHGVWFVSYEWCKVEMQKSIPITVLPEDSVVVPLVSGAVAATTAWAVGYPADLIKTRIQSRVNNNSSIPNLGILDTARELIAESPNGRVMAALYRGFGLKLVRSVPASMIGFTTYEFVKKQVLLESSSV
jgi:solute carrier family 25 (mitochondrial carnitine/acylcarnitine transporter), member 20/29